jgi:hypothetical protein
MRPYKNFLTSKIGIISLFITVGVLSALSVVIYKDYNASKRSATSQVNSNNSYKDIFNSFFSSVAKGGNASKDVHRELFEYLKNLDKSSFPDEQELKQFTDKTDIPYDYAFFFKNCLPAYSNSLKKAGATFSDENILLSLPRDANYKATIFINRSNIPAEDLSRAVDSKGSPNRLVISGTYTSPFNLPVGLTIDNGEIINPAIQKFDGILIINSNGRIHITHIDDLQHDFRDLRIKSSFSDFKEFMDLAAKEKLTVIQSFLIINHGEITFEESPSKEKIRRRILFETEDKGIHIFDSFDKTLTLFEAAKYLKDNYRAVNAISLETGTFNFCTLYKGNHLTDCSELKKAAVLSNLLIFDF